ncbi:molybdenum cofactor biosynthesis protein MoaE [Streptomyces sp. NPDC005529]|uniref:molybdenum cofactor biosynthesis protein MoaE n=1 Tax=unclassified Streptomyces TaxID=2593676 RepID=UPI0033A50583
MALSAVPARSTGRWCVLTGEPLRVDPLIDAVSGPGQHCIVVVIGTISALTLTRCVSSVDYQVYSPDAEGVLQSIVEWCEQTADGVRVALSHRTGVLCAGEASHVIAVSARFDTHAHAAARACQALLKERAPIWRRDIYTDGTEWTALRP